MKLTKQVSSELEITLSYENEYHEVTFTNTAGKSQSVNSKPETGSSWLSYFKSPEFEPVKKDKDDYKLYLGYVQLFGYIVRNYNIDVGSGALQMESNSIEKSTEIWENREYASQYRDFEQEDIDNLEERLDSIPLFRQKREVINGRVGGTIIEGEPAQDLIFVFNAQEGCGPTQNKELIDNIVPIYYTPQSLIFSDILLKAGESKSYRILFLIPDTLPPSYNAQLTGPICDLSYISLKYSLVLGYLVEEMLPKCVYFPITVCNKERRYSIKPTVDQEWKVNKVTKLLYNRSDFLADLNLLIDSGILNLPKMANDEENTVIDRTQTFFQIRYLSSELCLVRLSKMFYYVGEDIAFQVKLHRGSTEVVGFTAHLEAQEHYLGAKSFNHVYKCSPVVKFNTFASSIFEGNRKAVYGHMHIPSYLTKSFEIKDVISVKYVLVFKFNVLDIRQGKTYEDVKLYRFDAVGSEVKFNLPLVIN